MCPDCGDAVSIPTQRGPWSIGVLNVILHWRDKHPERYEAELSKVRARLADGSTTQANKESKTEEAT